MATGSIKKLVHDKGFGFIAIDGGDDVFFHHSSYEGSFEGLQEGQKVECGVEDGPKGPRATNVKVMAA
jgi:CspA family cold shock protein